MSALAARPVAGLLCICLTVLAISPSIASALNPASAGSAKLTAVDAQNDAQSPSSAGITASQAQGLDLLLTVLPLRYANADPTHDLALAAVTRVLAQGVQRQVLASAALLRARNPTRTARAIQALDRLTGELQATTTRFQPWPLTLEVSAWSARARAELDAMLRPPGRPRSPTAQSRPRWTKSQAPRRPGEARKPASTRCAPSPSTRRGRASVLNSRIPHLTPRSQAGFCWEARATRRWSNGSPMAHPWPLSGARAARRTRRWALSRNRLRK